MKWSNKNKIIPFFSNTKGEGPNKCEAAIPSEFTLQEGTNTIEIKLCGNPQPKLSYTFHGKTKEAEMIEKLDKSKQMYKYKIVLENVTRTDCGSTLKLIAEGHNILSSHSKTFVECK